jgi:hypothetical protein
MSSKRRVLDLLHRDELAAMVERHGVITGGRAKDHLAERLDEKGPPSPSCSLPSPVLASPISVARSASIPAGARRPPS